MEELLQRGMGWIGQSKENAGTGCDVSKARWGVFILVLAGVGVFSPEGGTEIVPVSSFVFREVSKDPCPSCACSETSRYISLNTPEYTSQTAASMLYLGEVVCYPGSLRGWTQFLITLRLSQS